VTCVQVASDENRHIGRIDGLYFSHSMSGKIGVAFLVAVIGGMILSIIEVDAQSTVDDSASCESSTLNEAVNLIREDLADVKQVCSSNQQQCGSLNSSSLCE